MMNTGNFIFQMKTSSTGYGVVYQTFTMSTSYFNPGAITFDSVAFSSGASSIIQADSDYDFTFTLQHALTSPWAIAISW